MPAAHRPPASDPHVQEDPLPGGTRERLLSAASELLAEGGVPAVTLRGVGERAGVSRTAPYRHFHNKEDLLAAVALETFRHLQRDMAAAVEADPSSVPQVLRRGLHVYVRFGLARPEHYRLIFHDPAHSSEYPGVFSESLQYLADLLARGQRAGEIRAGDPHTLVILTWSALHGLVSFVLAGYLERKGIDAEQKLFHLADELVAGLRT